MPTVKAFLVRKNIIISPKRYFVDALSSMAFGLFASLLIGTILGKVAELLSLPWLTTVAQTATKATGAALACSVGVCLGAPNQVLFSLIAVGLGAYDLGGPLGALICAIVASEFGKVVSKETKIDILVTPTVTILVGLGLSSLIGPGVKALMDFLGAIIMNATELQPFLMGVIVSVIVGMILSAPLSSAAICVALGLTGLAGGAATAGCCAQMVGFAVMTYSDNGWGGVVAQGLGTSKLQMGNIARNPRIWIPATLTGAITGPIATVVFGLQNGSAVASGMGTSGLIGPIGIMTAENFGTPLTWVGLVLVCFVLPAVLAPAIAYPLRKIGWIKPGDCKLDL